MTGKTTEPSDLFPNDKQELGNICQTRPGISLG